MSVIEHEDCRWDNALVGLRVRCQYLREGSQEGEITGGPEYRAAETDDRPWLPVVFDGEEEPNYVPWDQVWPG